MFIQLKTPRIMAADVEEMQLVNALFTWTPFSRD